MYEQLKASDRIDRINDGMYANSFNIKEQEGRQWISNLERIAAGVYEEPKPHRPQSMDEMMRLSGGLMSMG